MDREKVWDRANYAYWPPWRIVVRRGMLTVFVWRLMFSVRRGRHDNLAYLVCTAGLLDEPGGGRAESGEPCPDGA